LSTFGPSWLIAVVVAGSAPSQTVLDLNAVYCSHADTILPVEIPSIYWDSSQTDRFAAIHPSVVDFTLPWNGFRFWMAMTPYDSGLSEHENPCLRVSQDGTEWIALPGCNDPLFTTADVIWASSGIGLDTATYLSDPRLERDPDGSLWLMFRATWFEGFVVLPHSALLISHSYNGVDWSKPALICEPACDVSLMSPSFMINTNESWTIWTINGPVMDVLSQPFHYQLQRYRYIPMENNLELLSVCDETPSLWHMDFTKVDATCLIAFMTMLPNYDLFAAQSLDGGVSWEVADQPLLQGTGIPGTFNRQLYKSCGLINLRRYGAALTLYYGTWQGGAPDGIAYTQTFIPYFGAGPCLDLNHDGEGPDISDLMVLVNYMFLGAGPPQPLTLADVDTNGSCGDISDLVCLVTFMFQDGPLPPACR